MKKKNFKTILFFVLLFVFVFCIGLLLFNYMGTKNRSKIYDDIQESQVLTDSKSKQDSKTESLVEQDTDDESGSVSQKTAVDIPIDFDQLHEINPDIYAWIEIPGTEINYPIVQSSTDNNYYLNHTIEGAEGYPGSIYTELYNKKDFSDPNTILYGHNMKDNSMFGGLDSYRDPTYMAEHQEITVYTEEHCFTYKIFAAVTYGDGHLMYLYDFNDDSQFSSYVSSLLETRTMNDCVDRDVTVNPGDRLLTLYTCVGSGDSGKRLLVVGVLTDEQ